MGVLYRQFCSACDGEAQTNGTSANALPSTGRAGEFVSAGYVAYLARNGDLVPLPHPFESRTLHAAGETWHAAAMHGRLIYVRKLICADCGAHNTTASLHVGETGCVAGLVLAALVIGCNLFLFNFHLIIEFSFVWMALLAPPIVTDRYVKIRYRAHVIPHQTDQCVTCGGRDLLTLASARNATIPCPQCTGGKIRIEIAGRS